MSKTRLPISLAIASALAASATLSQASVEFRYFRFTPTELRNTNGANSVQIAEIQFFQSGALLTGATATNPGGDNPGNESPAEAVDNNPDTKWLNFNKFNPLIVDFGTSVQSDAYSLTTANDAEERDPVSWTLDGSNDLLNWSPLDTREGEAVPTERFTETPKFGYPLAADAQVLTFYPTPAIVETGKQTTLTWTTNGATTINLDGQAVAASGERSVSPTTTTTYTLVATGPDNIPSTRTTTVTVIEPGLFQFRFYRFRATELRGNDNSVQIAEFQMLDDNGERLGGANATNPGGDNPGGEGPQQGNDNDLSTKWLDFNKFEPLVLDFGSPTGAASYTIATANDAENRDPVSWKIDASQDGVQWVLLDLVENFDTPTDRDTFLDARPLQSGLVEPLAIQRFTASPVQLDAAGTATLTWRIEGATTGVTITGVADPLSSGTATVEPGPGTTTYTLTASNGTDTLSRTVAVKRGPATGGTFRFVRFTTTETRDPNTPEVQLSEFELFLQEERLQAVAASNPGGAFFDFEDPDKATDQDLGTKWLDYGKGVLILDYGFPVTFDAYRMASANDADGRDPVAWDLEGSLDGVDWSPVDSRSSQNAFFPTDRNTYTETITLEPAKLEPFLVVAAAKSANQFALTWQSKPGEFFQVQTSADLTADTEWSVLPTNLAIIPADASPATTTSLVADATGTANFYRVVKVPPPPLFTDGFETDLGWTSGTGGNQTTTWQRGQSGAPGPPSANSGSNCFGTNLTDTYQFQADAWLRSPPLDLSDPAVSAASLQFRHFHEIEEGFDAGTLRLLDATTNQPLGDPLLPLVDGSSGGWQPVRIALPTDAIGRAVKLEFRLTSDGLINQAGWYIDDVVVTSP